MLFVLFTGRCVEGERCKFPNLWLRPADKCAGCSRIIHPLCGRLAECKERYKCSQCADSTSESSSVAVTTVTQSVRENDSHDGAINGLNNDTRDETNLAKAVPRQEIIIKNTDSSSTIVSTITDSKDRTNFTSIPKDYFITSDQNINKEIKERDGDIWCTLKKAVSSEIDADLKAMMILRSQEIGLKVKKKEGVQEVKSWGDIGEAWKNDDSVDTAKKLYEIVHATFDDNSGFEIYMESKIMDRLELKYEEDSLTKKGCIARMVITRKSELNKLINKRTECTHQKKISSKRLDKIGGNRNSKGTFTIKGPGKTETFNRDGSICGSKGNGEDNRFDSHYYMELIRNLQKEKSMV